MVGHSQSQHPHDDNDDLSSLNSYPSIQNSPDWPSVRSLSPGETTLNESNNGTYRDDISSLVNFSCDDPESSDRGSVSTVTANISTSPSNSRSSTPSLSSYDQYQSPSPENLGASGGGRIKGFMLTSPLIRVSSPLLRVPLISSQTIPQTQPPALPGGQIHIVIFKI